MQLLYSDLRQERRLVAHLEAVLACGVEGVPSGGLSEEEMEEAGANGGGLGGSLGGSLAVDGALDGALADLVSGLQLQRLEERVSQFSAEALGELSGDRDLIEGDRELPAGDHHPGDQRAVGNAVAQVGMVAEAEGRQQSPPPLPAAAPPLEAEELATDGGGRIGGSGGGRAAEPGEGETVGASLAAPDPAAPHPAAPDPAAPDPAAPDPHPAVNPQAHHEVSGCTPSAAEG